MRKIAGHEDVDTTAEYTFVSPERQNELTRRIQARLAKAANAAFLARRNCFQTFGLIPSVVVGHDIPEYSRTGEESILSA